MHGCYVDFIRLGYEHPIAAEHPLLAVGQWADHVAAGRVGTPPPPPPAHADREYGCASLVAILAATPSARRRA